MFRIYVDPENVRNYVKENILFLMKLNIYVHISTEITTNMDDRNLFTTAFPPPCFLI